MRTSFRAAALLAIALAGSHAAAMPIEAGHDYLKTQPGSFWDFQGDEQKLPKHYFGPGSDPFEGQVAVVCGTEMWRERGSNFDDNPDVIPTEIVALQLHSAEPVSVTFDDGLRTVLYDVAVTLDPSGPNRGHYILALDPTAPVEGGTIDGDDDPPDVPAIPPDSFFDVCFRFTFTPQGVGPVVEAVRTDRVHLTEDVLWSSAAPALYAHAGAGGFYPGIDPFASAPPDPCIPQTMVYEGEAFTWRLRLAPVPEPGTLGLLGIGVLGLARRRRRRR